VLKDKRVVLGVTGSIAAYKAADVASKLTQASAEVDVVLTQSAQQFVTPLTFRSLTLRSVYADMYDPHSRLAEQHVFLARDAKAIVIAPASATSIARLAQGLADDLLSLTVLATKAPVLVCPAMDSQMYENAATQANLNVLKERGITIVGPAVGRLASGHTGAGRLVETEEIIGALRYVLGRSGDLAGRRIVVSAGGTQEPIDAVRYIGNYSSGKMGFAIAEAARDRGADTVLVSTPVALTAPYGVRLVPVKTAAQMRIAILDESREADALIMAAAVADYEPMATANDKIKRREGSLTLEFAPTADILADVPGGWLIKVGFAAESRDLLASAQAKLKAKGLHLIVANDITAPDAGFEADTNRVVILHPNGGQEHLPLMSKYDVAWHILDRVAALLRDRS
jgi:phosphopantothenoylcysteine decarboxylase/phosphopantothenate--cysteine ligase